MSRKKLWGGRFSSEEDPLFAEFNDSLRFDRELLEADIDGSIAYARALERAGVFTRTERLRVEKGLNQVRDDNRKDQSAIMNSDAEDVHAYVEASLSRKVGVLALKLHTGRSRNDQVATDLRLYLKEKAGEIENELNALLRVIADRAEHAAGVVIPGYTHLQRAQPVLFSHYLMAYGEMLLRDRERLHAAIVRTDSCPLGSGAISGTAYRIDRDMLAKDLRFASVAANSMDAVADRDFVLDFLFFASTLLMHLSRLAEDLILYNSLEFSFLQVDDSVSSGSSLMPQKKNPDALELLRGKTGRVYGHLMSLLTVLKGLPMTYNKDLQEDKEGLFDAVRTVSLCLRMIRGVLEKIRIDRRRMRESALKGYLNATELADYLAARGMPFREAHALTGKIVTRASELDLSLEELPLREYQAFSPLFEEGLYSYLDLERMLSQRLEKGGTAPETVKKAIRTFRKKIGPAKSVGMKQIR
ncbi:MAG TPA: argininosuccinate lyase [Acidobacteriota bacterium]|nr:argininosuccinate lyase [Acidobacteriota bacterium]